jgi:hypothetical protein
MPEKLVLLGYDAASLGSRTMEPLNMTEIRSFETSGTDYPVAQSHNSEKRIPEPNRCAKMKTRKSVPARGRASKPQQETYMQLHSLGILTYCSYGRPGWQWR